MITFGTDVDEIIKFKPVEGSVEMKILKFDNNVELSDPDVQSHPDYDANKQWYIQRGWNTKESYSRKMNYLSFYLTDNTPNWEDPEKDEICWITPNGFYIEDFTGQHRCVTDSFDYSEEKVGYIVSTGSNYKHLNSLSKNKINNIKISESLPFVNITSKQKDKKVFGVISDGEDLNESVRKQQYGAFGTNYSKNKDDNRIYINSVGEGAIWVSDFNGPLESGDYITSSDIPGIGMLQDAEMLMNYTVAKITMDCNFEPQIEPSMVWNEETEKYVPKMNEQGNPMYLPEYRMQYIKLDGTIIEKSEYDTLKAQNQQVFRMAFVGCTYHCG